MPRPTLPTLYAVQGWGCHAMPDVVRLCVLSKSGDVMPRPTLPTMCAVQGRWCNATPDVVLLCVQSKGGDVKPRPTSFDIVCHLRAMMECHARRRSTVCAVSRRRCYAKPDVVWPCVLPKGGDVMPLPTSSDRVMSCHARCCRPCVLSKGGDVMPRPMSFDFAFSPRMVMSCHTRHPSTVCAVKRQ